MRGTDSAATRQPGLRVHRKRPVKLAASLFFSLCSALPINAGLLDGCYRIISLTITYDEKPARGFNNPNPGLYIAASGKRVKVAGTWRGYPMERHMTVDRESGDTLFLRDAQNPASLFRFAVKGDTLTGRHALNYEDGTKQVMVTRAVLRKLNREEVDRLRGAVNLEYEK